MDRMAAGIIIAIAALLMNGGLVRDVLAAEGGAAATVSAATVAPVKSQVPVTYGLRSERVLSLVLTLEALRAAPAVLEAARV